MRLQSSGQFDAAVPATDAIGLFPPEGERAWVPGWDPSYPVFRFLGAVPDGDFHLQAVAVDPRSRGAGVGSTLIDHAEGRGRGLGCRRIALDVAVANRGAQKLYERLGFTAEATSPRSAILPEGQVHRMVKDL